MNDDDPLTPKGEYYISCVRAAGAQQQGEPMQTLLPYPSFRDTAKCLNDQHLRTQLHDCVALIKELIDARNGVTKPGGCSPVCRKWMDQERGLCQYALQMAWEWRDRFNDSEWLKFWQEASRRTRLLGDVQYPYWVSDTNIHESYRAQLLVLDEKWYRKYEWKGVAA